MTRKPNDEATVDAVATNQNSDHETTTNEGEESSNCSQQQHQQQSVPEHADPQSQDVVVVEEEEEEDLEEAAPEVPILQQQIPDTAWPQPDMPPPQQQQPPRRRRRRWKERLGLKTKPKDQAAEWAWRLHVGSEVLLEKLFAYLSQLPEEPDDEDDDGADALQQQQQQQPLIPSGMTLPAAAIGWLSQQIMQSNNHAATRTTTDRQWMNVTLRDRLRLLRFLLPRVTHLRITRSDWPPPIPVAERQQRSRRRRQQQRPHHHDDDEPPPPPQDILNCSATMSVASGLTMDTMTPPPLDQQQQQQKEELFLYYFQQLQHHPVMDLTLFPNLRVLVLEGIPPTWFSTNAFTKTHQKLQVLKWNRSCLYSHLPRLLFPPPPQQEEPNTNTNNTPSLQSTPTKNLYPNLTHLDLTYCGMGEMSKLSLTISKLTRLEALNLSHNEIRVAKTIWKGLVHNAMYLNHLNLSFNSLATFEKAHYHVGQLTVLKLSHNQLFSVSNGLDHLYSLQELWLDHNLFEDVTHVSTLSRLPLLQTLRLQGNPMGTEYRQTVLSWFHAQRQATTFDELPVLDSIRISDTEWSTLVKDSFRPAAMTTTALTANMTTTTTRTKINDKQQQTQKRRPRPKARKIAPWGQGMVQTTTKPATFPNKSNPKALHSKNKRQQHLDVEPNTKNTGTVITFTLHDVLMSLKPPQLPLSSPKAVSVKEHVNEKEDSPLKHNDDNNVNNIMIRQHSWEDDHPIVEDENDDKEIVPTSPRGEEETDVHHEPIQDGKKKTATTTSHEELPSIPQEAKEIIFLPNYATPANDDKGQPDTASSSMLILNGGNDDNYDADCLSSSWSRRQGGLAFEEDSLQLAKDMDAGLSLSGSLADYNKNLMLASMNEDDMSSFKNTDTTKNNDESQSQCSTQKGSTPNDTQQKPKKKVATVKLKSGATREFDIFSSDWDALVAQAAEGLIPNGKVETPMAILEQANPRGGAIFADDLLLPTTATNSTTTSDQDHYLKQSLDPLNPIPAPGTTLQQQHQLELDDSSQPSSFGFRSNALPDYVFEDDFSVPSSLGTSRDDFFPPKINKFQLAEANTTYDGPEVYKERHVLKNLELYFDLFVFPLNVPAPQLLGGDPQEETDEDDWKQVARRYPRIQLWPEDRRWMDSNMTPAGGAPAPMTSDLLDWTANRERFVKVWEEDLIPCGKPALRRLAPNRRTRLGFHGDQLYDGDGAPDPYAECRKVFLCLSSSAFYILLRQDAFTKKQEEQGKRKKNFPVPISDTASFQDAPWPHAVARHSFQDLRAITIGFEFQRLTLRFSNPSVRRSVDPFVYILLTSNKNETVKLLQDIQRLSKEANEQTADLISDGTAMAIENDSQIVFDALANAVAPDMIGTILHYQIVQQQWKHGERGTVRRVCIVTDTKIFLMDEDYGSDGHEKTVGSTNVSKVSYRLVDEATLKQIAQVQPAGQDPKATTIIVNPLSRLSRVHRWRLVCRDSHGAELLVENVRKAIAMAEEQTNRIHTF